MSHSTFPCQPGPLTAPSVMVGEGAIYRIDGIEFIVIGKTRWQLDMILEKLGIRVEHDKTMKLRIAPIKD